MLKRIVTCLLSASTLCLGAASAEDACDQTCKSRLIDQYLHALVTSAPDEAPLAESYRATENQHEIAPGEGLWTSATGFGPMQRRFFDEATGNAAFYGLVYEADGPALLSLRLSFDGQDITESEAIIARDFEPLYNPVAAIKEAPDFTNPADLSGLTREMMTTTADKYFDGLRDNTGEGIPKVDGCKRIENGTRVTNRRPGSGDHADEVRSGDCTSGFENFTSIAEIAHRRYPVADTEAGVVMGVGLFQRPPGAVGRDGNPRKRNLIHEYFRTDAEGRITEIFAVMRYIEADEPNATGWE
ncbi:MAG: hypothetical protein CMK09_16550 [Ponticaulis sp.]|nr:hypothetical protein [Ponticaulis sp.]